MIGRCVVIRNGGNHVTACSDTQQLDRLFQSARSVRPADPWHPLVYCCAQGARRYWAGPFACFALAVLPAQRVVFNQISAYLKKEVPYTIYLNLIQTFESPACWPVISIVIHTRVYQ